MNVETRSIWRSGRATLLLLAVFGLISSASAQPQNDNFLSARTLVGSAGVTNGTTLSASAEIGEPGHAGTQSASHSVWYQWTAPADGLFSFNTTGSDFNTVLAIYVGDDVAALEEVASNDDSAGLTSSVSFDAVAGETYMIAIDGVDAQATGNYFLAWSESGPTEAITKAAGTFQFTSTTYTCSELDSNDPRSSTVSSPKGALITVTRVGGAAGRVAVDYTTVDDTALAGTVPTNGHYKLKAGTLIFDDYQMSASFVVPIIYDLGSKQANPSLATNAPRQFIVQLSDAVFADGEDGVGIEPPQLDATKATATVKIQDVDAVGATPDDAEFVFNFEKSLFQVNETVAAHFARIYVVRTGTNDASCSVDYRINRRPDGAADAWNTYALQAGSDYVMPNYDYTPVTGTLSWGDKNKSAQFFDVPINDDDIVEFNEDMRLELYNPSTGGKIGNVGFATLTILFDDQPAGSADRNYNRDNNPNTTPPFNPSPGANSTVYAALVRPDGETFIAGDFTSYNAIARNRLALVSANGQLDSSFNPGTGADNFISSIALDYTNRLVVGGGFTSVNGLQRYGIARLNTNGLPDSTFNPGLGADGTVWAVAVQSNKVYIAGDFTQFNGTPRRFVARLNEDGSVDSSFNTASGPNGSVYSLALQADGKLIIGGSFTSVNGVVAKAIARLNADGSLDTNFNAGDGADDVVYSLALQADDKVLVGGAFTKINLYERKKLARLNPDGSIDSSFDIGSGLDDTVYTITVQPTNAVSSTPFIYVGGLFQSINGTRRVGVARLFPQGYVDTSFMDTAYNQYAGVTSTNSSARNFIFTIALQADSGVIIGGGFDRVGGGTSRTDIRPRRNVARLVGGSTGGPGNIGFTSDTYSADEGMSLYVSISRENGFLGSSGVTFTPQTLPPAPGTAEEGVDFTFNWDSYGKPMYGTSWSSSQMKSDGFAGGNFAPVSIVTNFNGNEQTFPGNKSADIFIDIQDDSSIESIEGLNMELSAPKGTDIFLLGGENIPLGTALGRSTANLSIIDNDGPPGVLGFNVDSFNVNEDAGTATITVTRTNGSNGSVSIQYATSNGSALSGSDYVATGSRTLTFGPGQTTRTFTVSILDDTAVEPDETVNLRLFGPTGGASLGQTNAVLVIFDNDLAAGKVSFSSATYNVTENAGVALVTVNRTGGSSGQLSVEFLATNLVASASNALAGVDYVATNGVLTWINGDTSPKTFSIRLLDDGVVEGMEKIDLRLSNPSTGTNSLGNTISARVNILEDDRYGNFSFNTTNYFTSDNAGTLSLTVLRNSGIAGTATVSYAVTDGSATNGVHYWLADGTLTFPPGVSSTNISLSVLQFFDTNIMNREFTVTLHSPTPVGGALLGAPAQTKVTIVDHRLFNEPAGTVDSSFNPAPGGNNFIYALGLQPDGRVLAGGDFTQLNGFGRSRIGRFESNGTLDSKFSSPSLGADSTVRSVFLTADGRLLIGGNFTLVNGNPRNYIARLNADGLIDTSFNPGSGADSPVYSVAETFFGGEGKIYVGGSFSTFNGVARNALVRLNTNGTVDVSFTPLGGANGTIYVVTPYPTNSIFAGKVLIGGDFTTVNGVNRARVARLNVDGSLDLSFDPGAGANNSVRTIVVQPDGNTLIGGLFTNFNGGSFKHIVRVNSSGGIDAGFNVGVGANDSVYAIALQVDGKILIGGEFTTASGVTRNRLTRLNADGTVDPTINFGLGANGFISSIAVQPDNKILISGGFTQFDDIPRAYIARLHGGSLSGAGTFEFTSGAYQVLESTNAVISIRRRGGTIQPADEPVTVKVDTSDIPGGALAGSDYSPVHSTISFPAGETFRSVVVNIVNDTLAENPEGLLLSLSDATGEAVVTNQPTATLTILSDDSQISFSSSEYRRQENAIDGAATITIVRTGSLVNSASFTFFTAGGTAVPNIDYTTISTNITFQPGESNKLVKISLIDDTLIEGDETVVMGLSNISGAYVGSPTNAVLTIADNDFGPGTVSFAPPTYIVRESAGTVVVNLIRTNGSTGVISVNYSTFDSSARAGEDYIQASGSIVFADSEVFKQLTLHIHDDKIVEPNESFNVTLFSPTGGATLSGSTNATVTIEDDEFGPGSLDTTFDPRSGANGWVRSVAVRTNGQVVIAGAFTSFDNTNRNYIAGLTDSGALDLSFNPGSGASAVVSSLGLMPPETEVVNGSTNVVQKISLGGAFTNVNGLNFNRAGRLFANGGADTNFNQITGLNAAVNSLVVQPDNNIVIGGGFSLPTTGIARLRPNGSLDSTFNIGSGANGIVHSVTLQTTNIGGSTVPIYIICGGDFTSVSGTDRSKVCRLHMNGLVDQSFSPPLITTGRVYSVAVQYDGRILIGGDFVMTSGTNTYKRLARLNVNGSVDSTFNLGNGANLTVYALALQLDGKILIGGDFTTINSSTRNRIARLNTDGSVDATFDPGSGADNTVYAISLLPNQKMLVAGDFVTVNGFSRRGIARLNGDDLHPAFDARLYAGGQMNFVIKTVPTFTYKLEASSDLVVWTTIATYVAPQDPAVGTTWNFSDSNAASFSGRFYRLLQVNP